MSLWRKGLSAIAITRSFNAVLAREFTAGEKVMSGGSDAAMRSLMLGKGQSAFEVAAMILDIAQRDFSKENFTLYLGEALRLDRASVERAVRTRFPDDGSPGHILPLVVRRELLAVGAGKVCANLDKYMRGFEIAGFIARKRTGQGPELAYRCTEKADRLEDMIRGELDGKEAA